MRAKMLKKGFLAALLVLFVCINGAGLYVGSIIHNEMSILNSRQNNRNPGRWKQVLENGINNLQWKNISLESRFGYPLLGTFIPNPAATEKTLIFLHGFTENRLVGLQFRQMYLSAGFNVLLVDLRAHGESGGNSVTWGVYEKCDLDQWVDWVREKYPKGVVGVHGLSMGAVTALLHAEQNETALKVAFYIADSAYSDFETVLAPHAEQRLELAKKIPLRYIWPYVNAVSYFKSGFTYNESSPIRSVRKVTTPILFIHGEADKLVPVGMSQELYQAARGPREIYTNPTAGHVASYYQDRVRYAQVVSSFIKSLEKVQAAANR